MSRSNKHRRIYEKYVGPIPRDVDGRSYEIHHIDGNHYNNDPANLKAVTIQEHYDIHFAQGDYNACLKIGARMQISVEVMSMLGSLQQQKRIKDGTHNWLKANRIDTNKKRVENGTHNFLGPAVNKKRIEDGTHNFLGPHMNRKRLEDGTHNFLGLAKKRVAEGTHNFGKEHSKRLAQKLLESGSHHSQKIHTCPHCNKSGKSSAMFQWHFNKCKLAPQSEGIC